MNYKGKERDKEIEKERRRQIEKNRKMSKRKLYIN